MLHVETSIRDVNVKSGLQRTVTGFITLTILSFLQLFGSVQCPIKSLYVSDLVMLRSCLLSSKSIYSDHLCCYVTLHEIILF